MLNSSNRAGVDCLVSQHANMKDDHELSLTEIKLSLQQCICYTSPTPKSTGDMSQCVSISYLLSGVQLSI